MSQNKVITLKSTGNCTYSIIVGGIEMITFRKSYLWEAVDFAKNYASSWNGVTVVIEKEE